MDFLLFTVMGKCISYFIKRALENMTTVDLSSVSEFMTKI